MSHAPPWRKEKGVTEAGKAGEPSPGYVLTFLRTTNKDTSKTAIETPAFEVLQLLYAKLPAELVQDIFGWLAVASYGKGQNAMDLSTFKGAISKAHDMLNLLLPDIDYDAESSTSNTDISFAKMCLDSAAIAILQHITILPANVSNSLKTPTARFPLQDCARYLHHLELPLTLVFIGPAHARVILPGPLYEVQQHLETLQTWYPSLHTIIAAVYIRSRRGCPQLTLPELRRRGVLSASELTVEEGLASLVQTLQQSGVRNCTLRIRRQRRSNGEDVVADYGKSADAAVLAGKSRADVIELLLDDNEWSDWEIDDRQY